MPKIFQGLKIQQPIPNPFPIGKISISIALFVKTVCCWWRLRLPGYPSKTGLLIDCIFPAGLLQDYFAHPHLRNCVTCMHINRETWNLQAMLYIEHVSLWTSSYTVFLSFLSICLMLHMHALMTTPFPQLLEIDHLNLPVLSYIEPLWLEMGMNQATKQNSSQIALFMVCKLKFCDRSAIVNSHKLLEFRGSLVEQKALWRWRKLSAVRFPQKLQK